MAVVVSTETQTTYSNGLFRIPVKFHDGLKLITMHQLDSWNYKCIQYLFRFTQLNFVIMPLFNI